VNSSSGKPKCSFWQFLLRLLGITKSTPEVTPKVETPASTETSPPSAPSESTTASPSPTTVPTTVPADNNTEPVRTVSVRVLLVIYNPVMDPVSGESLIERMHWNDPDVLTNTFINDILEVSSGLARYQVVQRVSLNEFPALSDGYRYTPADYTAVMSKSQPAHQPQYADYQAILTGLNVIPQVTSRQIDEVWLMGFPQAGFYESSMCGEGAFWCNSEPQTWSAGCSRRFVVMGFSTERGVGEMIHSFGHRAESILKETFSHAPAKENLFAQFLRYDKEAPGDAQLGSIHYPPNAEHDYDYNNPRKVLSNCYDWFNFPNFQDDVRLVNADEWGNGDLRILHKWWLNHLPKVAGRTSGIVNNWWQYIMDPNLVNL
jgi:hypothetical protein